MGKTSTKQYRITDACIGCEACVNISSKHFSMNSASKAVVSNQPANDTEEKLCSDAVLFCPVSAIVESKMVFEETGVKKVSNEESTQKIKIPFLKNVFRAIWFRRG